MPENIVDSLFGPQPWQIQQQQNQNLGIAADKFAAQDGFQRATGQLYRAGGMLGGAGMEAAGYQNPAIAQAERQRAVMATGGDMTTSAGLKAKAAEFAAAGDQQTAMKLIMLARKQEQEESKMKLESKKDLRQQSHEEYLQKAAHDLKVATLEGNIAARERDAATRTMTAAETARHNKVMEGLQAQLANMKAESASAGNKPPAGYRWTPDGDLERIPGGPADLKASAQEEQKATGAAGLNSTLATLRNAYDRLERGGGITSTSASARKNIGAATSASGIGQFVGKIVGSENQSARNDIAMTRPALLASLMKATGMSAKQIDSNAELKLWLTTATDPTLDVESNRRALASIEDRYLSGNKAPSESQPSSQQGWSIKKK